jgi:hypothetical protein
MTERRYIIFLVIGLCLWGGLFYLILNHAPRTHNPTDCKQLAQPDQDKCKARRKV